MRPAVIRKIKVSIRLTLLHQVDTARSSACIGMTCPRLNLVLNVRAHERCIDPRACAVRHLAYRHWCYKSAQTLHSSSSVLRRTKDLVASCACLVRKSVQCFSVPNVDPYHCLPTHGAPCCAYMPNAVRCTCHKEPLEPSMHAQCLQSPLSPARALQPYYILAECGAWAHFGPA